MRSRLGGAASGASGTVSSEGLEANEDTALKEELQCPICFRLLFDPVVTACGHAFCSSCLKRLVRHSAQTSRSAACPCCRAALPLSDEISVARPFATLLESRFPALYARRQAEGAAEVDAEVRTSQNSDAMGVFVLDAMLPSQALTLNVYEQRYLAMVNRSLQGSRRFAMLHKIPSIGSFGTEVEVVQARLHYNGSRLLIKVVGRRVFRVDDAWMSEEGFHVVRAQFLQGEGQLGFCTSDEDVLGTSREIESAVHRWEHTVRSRGYERFHNHLNDVHENLGALPSADLPADRALWAAALVNPLPPLGVAREVRPAILAATGDPGQQLRIVLDALRESSHQMERSSAFRRYFGLVALLVIAVSWALGGDSAARDSMLSWLGGRLSGLFNRD